MKRYIWIMTAVVEVCAVALFAAFYLSGSKSEAPKGKVMSIESYVTQHISDFSPEKEILGGKFQVTSIQLTPGVGATGTGVVSYEDGHNAYTADFNYAADDFTGITITNFVIRK